jgi:hypothetical protein
MVRQANVDGFPLALSDQGDRPDERDPSHRWEDGPAPTTVATARRVS